MKIGVSSFVLLWACSTIFILVSNKLKNNKLEETNQVNFLLGFVVSDLQLIENLKDEKKVWKFI